MISCSPRVKKADMRPDISIFYASCFIVCEGYRSFVMGSIHRWSRSHLIYGWLLTRRARAHFAVFLHYSSVFKIKNLTLCYIRSITPKRVTSGGVHLSGLAPGQHSSEETSQRWRAGDDNVSCLTGQGIKPQTRHTDSACLTTELTGRFFWSFQFNNQRNTCQSFDDTFWDPSCVKSSEILLVVRLKVDKHVLIWTTNWRQILDIIITTKKTIILNPANWRSG